MPESESKVEPDVSVASNGCGHGVENISDTKEGVIGAGDRGSEKKKENAETDMETAVDDEVNIAKSKDSKMEDADDLKVTANMTNVEANDAIKVEAEDMKRQEIEDAEKEEAETIKGKELDNAKDVELEEKGVEGKKMKEIVREEDSNGNVPNNVTDSKVAEVKVKGLNYKQVTGHTFIKKEEAKEKKGNETKVKEISTPVSSSIERPVRERKIVARLVEVLDIEPVKQFIIEKGLGTPLKDIPNVAYKLSKKKPADLRTVHQMLFGKSGKASNYKNHILQFSGFVWHESEDKQKTKVKEKLDKCTKDKLMYYCDLFDLPFSRAHARKEELVAMLLDFMVAPHATTDVILSEKEQQSSKARKRKRGASKGSRSNSSGRMAEKQSRKENIMSRDSPKPKGQITLKIEDEEEHENGVPAEHGAPELSESHEEDLVFEEAAGDDMEDVESGKVKQGMKSPKRGGLGCTKKLKVNAVPPKTNLRDTAKSPTKTSSSKHSMAGNKPNAAFSARKKKDDEPPMSKKNPSKTGPKEKASGKKVTKDKESGEAGPSKDQLRAKICELLKKVDFNTATFTDILKELASHYGMDLTTRKASIKLIIQEELTKLAEEDEDTEEDDEDESDDE